MVHVFFQSESSTLPVTYIYKRALHRAHPFSAAHHHNLLIYWNSDFSVPCFVLSSVTEMRALYLSIGFSSPVRYMLMTAFTILDIVLCKSKRTAIARSCEVTRED